MLHSYGKAGIRPVILLSLFAQWARDNPKLGAKEFSNAFFDPLGIQYRHGGYTLTDVLPQHGRIAGDNKVTDQSGNDISASVRTDKRSGSDILALTPSNFAGDSLAQFLHYNPFCSPGKLDVDKAAEWYGNLGLSSLPYPFNDPADLAVVRRALHHTEPFHVFDAIASVAGFHIPYFAGGVATGQAFVTEPGCSWILSEKEADGNVSFHKLSPSANWNDWAAVNHGFAPSVTMGHWKTTQSQCHESVQNARRDQFGLVSCGRMESHTDGAMTVVSNTRLLEYNPGISCKTAVLNLAIASMLQWARGERRSCDSPVMPGFGKGDAFVTKLPVDPLNMGFEPVWETPVSDPVAPMGDLNAKALETLLKRMVADMKLACASSSNGPTSDRMAPNMAMVDTLFSKVKLVPDFSPISSARPGLVLESGSVFDDARKEAIKNYDEPIVSNNCVAFNVFRGNEAKRITERVPTSRKAFEFLGMGKVSLSAPWVSAGSAEGQFAYKVESALKRFSKYE